MHGWSTLKKLIWLYKAQGGGTPSVEETVTGVSPLVLAAALKRKLISLVQSGKTEQATAPTPSAPVDIYCNNGKLVMVDDELPAGYKRVLGYSCKNNAMWEITGFHLRGSDTVRISFSIDGACNVWGCYQGADATDNYDLYASTSSGAKYLRYADGIYLSYWSSANLGVRFDVVYTPQGTQGMPQDSTWTPRTFESANSMLIGSTAITGSSAKLKGDLYGDIIVDGRLHLIPCERLTDNVLGYWDTYSETFYPPYTGFAGATSLGYDGSHYHLVVVGTDEVISLYGKNLNGGTLQHTGFTSTGGVSTSDTFCGTGTIIPCTAGDKYTVSFGGFTSSGISGVFVSTWKTDGTFNMRQAISSSGSTTYTIPADVNRVNFTLYKTGGVDIDSTGWMQVEAGSSATDYNPYIAPQTASAVDLFGVGSYADTQDIISGAVARRIGWRIFDGTESFSKSTAYGKAFLINAAAAAWGAIRNNSVLCTHFLGLPQASSTQEDNTCFFNQTGHFYFRVPDNSDADAFKTWLAGQYAQGTPVIVVYALADATEEQTAPQNLNTNAGTNTIIVTAEVSDIPLEVTYIKEA